MGAAVQVKIYGTLRAHRPPADSELLTVGPDDTVESVIEELGIPAEKVYLVFLNGEKVDPGTRVTDGDLISLFPALGGG